MDSPQFLHDLVTKAKDPKDGIKLKKKVSTDKKKKKVQYFQGNNLVEFILKDVGERSVISKQDASGISQTLLDRDIITKIDGNNPKRFSDVDSYVFNDEASEALEIEAILKNSDKKQLIEVARAMGSEGGVQLKEKKYRLRKYKNCFTGLEAMEWLQGNLGVDKQNDSFNLAQKLQMKGYFINVLSKTDPFSDKAIYKLSPEVISSGRIQGGDSDDEDEAEEEKPTLASSSPQRRAPPPPARTSTSGTSSSISSSPSNPLSKSAAPSPHPPPNNNNNNNNNNTNANAPPVGESPRGGGAPPRGVMRGAPPRGAPRGGFIGSESLRTSDPFKQEDLSRGGGAAGERGSDRGRGGAGSLRRPPPPHLDPANKSPSMEDLRTNEDKEKESTKSQSAHPPPPQSPHPQSVQIPNPHQSIPLAASGSLPRPPPRKIGLSSPSPSPPPSPSTSVAPVNSNTNNNTNTNTAPPPVLSDDEKRSSWQTRKPDNGGSLRSSKGPAPPIPTQVGGGGGSGSGSGASTTPTPIQPLTPAPIVQSNSTSPRRRPPPSISPPNSNNNINNNNAPAQRASKSPKISKEQRKKTTKTVFTPDKSFVINLENVNPNDELAVIRSEFLSNEQSFVNFCLMGLNIYRDSSKNKMDDYQRESVFANMEEIIEIHKKSLLSANAVSIGDILMKLIPTFRVYLKYIANLSHAFDTVKKLQSLDFFDSVDDHEMSVPPIESFLETPSRHLSEYPSQIRDYIQRLHLKDPSEVSKLNRALGEFDMIFDAVKRREFIPNYLTRLWDLEFSFENEKPVTFNAQNFLIFESEQILISDSGAPIRSGYNVVILFIFNNGTCLFTSPFNGYSLSTLIQSSISSLTVTDVSTPQCKHGLEITSSGRKLLVGFPGAKEKRIWSNYLPVSFPKPRPLVKKIMF